MTIIRRDYCPNARCARCGYNLDQRQSFDGLVWFIKPACSCPPPTCPAAAVEPKRCGHCHACKYTAIGKEKKRMKVYKVTVNSYTSGASETLTFEKAPTYTKAISAFFSALADSTYRHEIVGILATESMLRPLGEIRTAEVTVKPAVGEGTRAAFGRQVVYAITVKEEELL